MDSRKHVILDWGGVIMRTVDDEPRRAWDQRLGLAPGTVEQIVHGIEAWQQAQRGDIPLTAYWEAVRRKLDLSPSDVSQLREDFYSGDQLDEELLNYIRSLQKRRVPVGLLSNNTADLADTLQRFDLTGLFDAVVISAEIGIMKPDPAAYYAILDRLQTAPEQAIFVDDFPQNIVGAREVGMTAVHYTSERDIQPALDEWLSE